MQPVAEGTSSVLEIVAEVIGAVAVLGVALWMAL